MSRSEADGPGKMAYLWMHVAVIDQVQQEHANRLTDGDSLPS
jgi:hypothetical protein